MIFGFTITSPRQSNASMQWRHPASLRQIQFKMTILQESDAHSLLGSRSHTAHRIPTVIADSYCSILRKRRKAIQRKRPGLTGPGKSLPGSDSSPKNFMLLVFGGLWNDATSASMHREIMLRNKSIFQISNLVCLISISICNSLIDLPTYLILTLDFNLA
jgi:hypothetical protein